MLHIISMVPKKENIAPVYLLIKDRQTMQFTQAQSTIPNLTLVIRFNQF